MTRTPTPVLYGPIKQVGQHFVYETYVAGEGRVQHPYRTRELAEQARRASLVGLQLSGSYRAFSYSDEMGFEGAIERVRASAYATA